MRSAYKFLFVILCYWDFNSSLLCELEWSNISVDLVCFGCKSRRCCNLIGKKKGTLILRFCLVIGLLL